MAAVTSMQTRPGGGRARGGTPAQRFADVFGRLAALLAIGGLVVAVGLAVAPHLLDQGGTTDHRTTYLTLPASEPLRISVGATGAVMPVVAGDVDPATTARQSPVDAPLVTWWRASAKPGAVRGQTVLTAHAEGTTGGLTAIDELVAGDTVDVLTKQGTMRYRITGTKTLITSAFQRLAPSLARRGVGGGRLVMVSCEQWEGVTYLRFVVVTGTPLGEPH